jgi:CHAD domain-containing protein
VLEETLRAAILGNQAQIASNAWLAEVKAGEVDLREAAVALIAGPDLDAMCVAATKLLSSHQPREQLVAVYAEERFDEVRAGVRELLPVGANDVDRLHRLRIRFKRLRYTCEMLAQFMTVIDATGSEKKQRAKAHEAGLRFSATARDASRMQKELGLLHDADQALGGLKEATMSEDDRVAIESALMDLRDRLVRRSLAQLGKLPRRIVGDGPTVLTVEKPQLVRA